MIRRQRTRSLAFLQAEWIPMLASIPLSQVVRGALEVSLNLLMVEGRITGHYSSRKGGKYFTSSVATCFRRCGMATLIKNKLLLSNMVNE